MKSIDLIDPDLGIIDSIQTISDSEIQSTPGSTSQIRECTMRILRITKEKGLAVFLVGHITKDGLLAGPKILEHMVDCVLYFEGERDTSFRILRAVKNRFGSTNEIGVFEMDSNGLVCVDNPSEVMLSGRPQNVSGTSVTCAIEGTRPILAEIQALVTENPRNNASRRSNGIDYNRAAMLIAVLEKRSGLPLGNCDSYIFLGGKEPTTLKELSQILGKETIDTFNTGESRGREVSRSLNYTKLGKDLATVDELAVLDGGKCILQLRGVRPFLSDKYDITKHPNYRYLSDYNKRNEFRIEKYLSTELKIKEDESYDTFEVDI